VEQDSKDPVFHTLHFMSQVPADRLTLSVRVRRNKDLIRLLSCALDLRKDLLAPFDCHVMRFETALIHPNLPVGKSLIWPKEAITL